MPRNTAITWTRNFNETVLQRVHSDSSFVQALVDEAAALFQTHVSFQANQVAVSNAPAERQSRRG